jgi:hypothetical protein
MRRRSPKPATPLNDKQAELAQRENQLREKMAKLERMIEDAPRRAEETTRRNREELIARAHEGGSRLDVSIALNDKRFGDGERYNQGRPRALRKERREGRLVFLVLVLALAIAVIWLLSNLRF